ncbi:hypothetical protein [Pararcticibacter amylolyticus]|uniref:Uncharacterized protein n=1 Tax=Pararcticibacter amylolyticus TaxID=2173175 RepID=A0A2U2PDH5_9SPHI|nr:hypothetical protein [Pararcticibacter amylolyticus]PWG79179.1 hypothetical protein DDR33_17985 [Pararcticibacter amylolyticus]
MKKVTSSYYKLPVGSIPFKEIPSLEDINYEYVYCKSFPLIDFMTLDFYLTSVYAAFDNEVEEVQDLQNRELLFGSVVADKFLTRGKAKCIKFGSIEEVISAEQLPHLRYCSNENRQADGKWFYMKDGHYTILSGIRSDFDKVKHLEAGAIYGDNIIRLRIVIEFLKRNVKDGLVELSEDQYKEIAYKVLCSDPTLLKSDDTVIVDGVNNWVPAMLLTPLYSEIPIKYRGKVMELQQVGGKIT